MREGYKTPKECIYAWAHEFLSGTEEPNKFWARQRDICEKCKDYNECYPPIEKWDKSMIELAKSIKNAIDDMDSVSND